MLKNISRKEKKEENCNFSNAWKAMWDNTDLIEQYVKRKPLIYRYSHQNLIIKRTFLHAKIFNKKSTS